MWVHTWACGSQWSVQGSFVRSPSPHFSVCDVVSHWPGAHWWGYMVGQQRKAQSFLRFSSAALRLQQAPPLPVCCQLHGLNHCPKPSNQLLVTTEVTFRFQYWLLLNTALQSPQQRALFSSYGWGVSWDIDTRNKLPAAFLESVRAIIWSQIIWFQNSPFCCPVQAYVGENSNATILELRP